MRVRPRFVSGLATVASALAVSLSSCAKDSPTEPKVEAVKLLITVQPAASVSVGSAISMLVLVADADNNPVVSETPSITISLGGSVPTGAVLGGTKTRTAANGVALFDDLTVDKAGAKYALTASAAGSLMPATSDSFTVVGLPATKLVILSQPTSVASLAAMSAVQVAVADANGNTVTTSTASITIALTSGTGAAGAVLGGTLTRSAVNGVATFSGLSVDKAGTGYTLTTNSGGLTGATSSAFNVTPGAAAKLGYLVQPASVVAGASISPSMQVAVQDASGNTVTTATNSITVSITPATGGAGATLSGTPTAAAASGVATFAGLSIAKAGSGYTLTATATNLTAAASTAFDVTVGPAAKLAFVVQPSAAASGVVVSPAVQVAVQDASGNTVSSATNGITLAITAGSGAAGANLSGTVAQAAVAGTATFANLAIDKVGTGYTLSATATGLTATTSASFAITVGAASKLTVTTSAAGAPSGGAFTTQPVVAVQDAAGNTVTSDNSLITMTVSAGATVVGTATATAAAGVATYSTVGISGKADTTYTLTFSKSGLTSATQNIVVTPGAPNKLAYKVQPPTGKAVGEVLSPALQVIVQDASGNTVTSATTSVTMGLLANAPAAALGGTKTVSAVSGIATFSTLTLDKPGLAFTLQATATGLTSVTSDAFAVTGPAAALVFNVQPSSSVRNAALSPAVEVRVVDAGGSLVTTATTSVAIAIGTNPGAATLGGTLTKSAVAGVATFTNVTLSAAGTGYTITATASGLTSVTSSTFDIAAFGTASQLAFSVQPSNTAIAATISPAVKVAVQDAVGNVVTSATNSITVAIGTNPASGILSGTVTMAAVSGVATFSNLAIDKAGAYTLTAAATALTGATSGTFDVTGAVPATMTKTAGDAQAGIAGGAVTVLPSVTVKDAGGNGIAGVTVTFAVASGGGSITSATPTTDASGVATVGSWTLGALGANTLTASANGVTSQTFAATGHFASLRAAGYRTCGLTAAGKAYCWGQNNLGQLGDGTTTDRSLPTAVVQSGLSFASLVTGYKYTCGLTSAGAAYCWGENANGQLGDGTTTNRSAPTAVIGGITFASLAGGDMRTCGLTPAGAAYCWGENAAGGIGDGTTTQRTSPTLVLGGLAFQSLSVGIQFSCGLTTAGAMYCWGYNGVGELGDGTSTMRLSPVAVLGGLVFASFNGMLDHNCALTAAGVAYCWGYNVYGQVGNNSNTNAYSPTAVSGGLTFASLGIGGGGQSCGLTSAGAAYCWGRNGSGEFGNGTLVDKTFPVVAGNGMTFSKLYGGRQHSCGISGGVAYCWGYNGQGGLGDGTTTERLTPVAVVLP